MNPRHERSECFTGVVVQNSARRTPTRGVAQFRDILRCPSLFEKAYELVGSDPQTLVSGYQKPKPKQGLGFRVSVLKPQLLHRAQGWLLGISCTNRPEPNILHEGLRDVH